MSDIGAPPAKRSRNEIYYCEESRSDAVIHVNHIEFHIQKRNLAAKLPYFEELFFVEGSEDKKVFSINESHSNFQFIIDVLYKRMDNRPGKPCEQLDYSSMPFEEIDLFLEKTFVEWEWNHEIIATAEKYGVATEILSALNQRYFDHSCQDASCLFCSMAGLTAIHHGVIDEKHNINLCPKLLAWCLKTLCTFTNYRFVDRFNISPTVLLGIFKRHPIKRNIPIAAASEDSKERIVVEVGDASLSDVTLGIGNYDFKVHKMTLASRSPYFRAMFYGNFNEKGKDYLSIDGDGEAFKIMMELLYDADFENAGFLRCCSSCPKETLKRVAKFWDIMPRVVETLTYFAFPMKMLEIPLGFHWCGKSSCVECANKMILAALYDLDNIKEKMSIFPNTLLFCLIDFACCLPKQLPFPPSVLADLLIVLNCNFEAAPVDGVVPALH